MILTKSPAIWVASGPATTAKGVKIIPSIKPITSEITPLINATRNTVSLLFQNIL